MFISRHKPILLLIISVMAALPFGMTFPQVATGNPQAVPVEYRFNHTLSPADSGVGLNGAFNNWLGGVFRMKQYQPNWWKVTLELLPLTYEYKFVTFTDTVGQSGVTGYFSDPLNPAAGGPFNNSYSNVRNPMIYYFLPKSGSTITNDHPTITANVSYANNARLDLPRMKLLIDDIAVANPSQYYDTAARLLSYTPPLGLSLTQHTAKMTVFTTSGDSAVSTTTFTVSSIFSIAPYIYKFDSKSPNFQFQSSVNRVDIKGEFNSGGNNSMTDPDSDGVYTFTANLKVNKPDEYTIIVNSGSYINDPDNPNLSNNHRTYAIKNLNRIPEFRYALPASCKVYNYPIDSVIINTTAYKSDSSFAMLADSIKASYDGSPVPVRLTNFSGTYDITVSIPNPAPGRHVVRFYARDSRQNAAIPMTYVFAVKNQSDVYYAVDDEEDDKGMGNYTYPAGIVPGCADIRDISIRTTQNLDSLEFAISMRSISDNTRLGFMIFNRYDGTFTKAMQDIELKVPEWNNRGVYLILAKPGSQIFNSLEENKLFISRDPLQSAGTITPDNTSLASGIFRFKLPMSALESIMGTYKDKWYFTVFSYLKDLNGTVEVTPAIGGSSDTEDPDVYDALFFNGHWGQQRLLSNFNSPLQIGGTRIAAIGSNQRGAMAVSPADINPLLNQIPEVKIFGDGGDLLTDTVRVTGTADITPGSAVTLHVNSAQVNLTTNDNKQFISLVSLTEGLNKITASVLHNGRVINSKTLIYNYIKDHNPKVKISGSLPSGEISFDGSGSSNPDGGTLTFKWEQDASNPQQIQLASTTAASISFPVPAKKGDYYFTLSATNGSSQKGWARCAVMVTDSGAYLPDLPVFHSRWIDTAIVYCVFVRTFDAAGTFNSVTSRMNELRDLGINCIWFLPIHPTTGNLGPDNPGYATTNYLDVLSNYGTKDEFRALVEKAHENGIKVILDHVIQHTSDLHPFMKDANKYKQSSPYYPFYYWDSNNNFQYLFTWVDLPSLNYDNEITRNYLLRAAKYWTQEFKTDGFRCDVAWAINDMRAQGPAYWQKWRQELKSMKPDVFLLAEADAAAPRYFDAKFDAAYDYNWFNKVRSIISGTTSIASLDTVINQYYATGYPKHARQFRYLENQDEQRFIEAFGVANAKLASAFLFSTPGIPMLYAGQEVGEMSFRGTINWSDPQLLRPYFKKLIRLRSKTPALQAGDIKRIPNNKPDNIYSFLRISDTSNVICNYNFTADSVSFVLNVPIQRLSFDSLAIFYLNDVLNNVAYQVTCKDLKNYQMSLGGKSAQILVLSRSNMVSVDEPNESLPASFNLAQNYPNPFNPSTTIRYDLPFAGNVKLQVFNILGQKIAELVNGVKSAGSHTAVFNGERLASGVYFFRIEAKSFIGGRDYSAVKKMILMK